MFPHNDMGLMMAHRLKTFEEALLPEVSLQWWPIHCNDEDKGKAARLHRSGWFGTTITNYNEHECSTIRKWYLQRAKSVYCTNQVTFLGGDKHPNDYIGDYKCQEMGMWVSTPELLAEFIQLLDSFPKRDTVLHIRNPHMLDRIEEYLEGTNYRVIVGSDEIVIGITDEVSQEDSVLIRLML